MHRLKLHRMKIVKFRNQKLEFFSSSNEYISKIIKEKTIDAAVVKVKRGKFWPKHKYRRLEGGKSYHLFFDGKWKLKVNRKITTFDGSKDPTLFVLGKNDWIEGKVVGKKDGMLLSFFSPPFKLEESEYF